MALTTVNPALLDTQAQYTGFKNRIINGNMVIDQRNAGASVTANSSNTPYVTDRFNLNVGSSSAVITGQQVSDAPAGFINSLRLTVSTTTTASAAQFLFMRQVIEGLNIADLGWGTASAKTVTVSFWVKASVTGTYALFAINSAEDRSYVSTFSVGVASTWEYKTITIPGDTTGTWLTNNSNGIRLGFDLGSGSNFQGTANVWTGAWRQRTSGTVSFCQQAGATFAITGLQLEAGTAATSFDYRPYGTELALCQRYFEIQSQYLGITASSTALRTINNFRVEKRANPTVSLAAALYTDFPGSAAYTQSSANITLNAVSTGSAVTECANFSGMTQGRPQICYTNMLFSAEL